MEEVVNPEQVAPQFTYVRPINQDKNCDIEKMITIEAVSLRKGGWRHNDRILSDLRHLDPKLATVIFFAILSGVIFFIFWRRCKSIPMTSLYTTYTMGIMAVVFSALLGIDFFTAVGAHIM